MDLHTLQWHEPTLKTFGINKDMLATIHSSAEALGRVASGPLAGVAISGVRLQIACPNSYGRLRCTCQILVL